MPEGNSQDAGGADDAERVLQTGGRAMSVLQVR